MQVAKDCLSHSLLATNSYGTNLLKSSGVGFHVRGDVRGVKADDWGDRATSPPCRCAGVAPTTLGALPQEVAHHTTVVAGLWHVPRCSTRPTKGPSTRHICVTYPPTRPAVGRLPGIEQVTPVISNPEICRGVLQAVHSRLVLSQQHMELAPPAPVPQRVQDVPGPPTSTPHSSPEKQPCLGSTYCHRKPAPSPP